MTFCHSLFWQIKNDSLCTRFMEHAKAGGVCHWILGCHWSFHTMHCCFVLPFSVKYITYSVKTQAHGWLISHRHSDSFRSPSSGKGRGPGRETPILHKMPKPLYKSGQSEDTQWRPYKMYLKQLYWAWFWSKWGHFCDLSHIKTL